MWGWKHSTLLIWCWVSIINTNRRGNRDYIIHLLDKQLLSMNKLPGMVPVARDAVANKTITAATFFNVLQWTTTHNKYQNKHSRESRGRGDVQRVKTEGDWICFRLGYKGRHWLVTDLDTDSDWHRWPKSMVTETEVLT